MNPAQFFCSLLFLPVFFSCDNANQKDNTKLFGLASIKQEQPAEKEKANEPAIPPGNPGQVPQASSSRHQATGTVSNTDWDKKIIKTASLRLEVKEFRKFNELVHNTVRRFGGYIAQEDQHLGDEKSEAVLSIKVLVEQFEAIMGELTNNGVRVMERSITSQDVTGEVIDTKSRLEAKKQVRLKYLDFLKASRNMEEVLKVQHEINGIQEEMEAAAGRIDYLSHQSAFSTVNLVFYQPLDGFKPIDLTPSYLSRLGNSFESGAEWIANFFLVLVSVWPLWFIGIAFVLAFKKIDLFKKRPQNS